MIQAMANRLAVGIKNVVPEHPRSVEVLGYAIYFLLNALFIIFLTLAISLVTGRTGEAAIALIAFAVLRQASGGLHIKNGAACIAVSTAVMTGVSLAQFTPQITLVLTGVAFVLALLFAPSRIEKQTRIAPRFFPLLKAISAVIIATNFFFMSPVLAATFFVQAVTLIRGRR